MKKRLLILFVFGSSIIASAQVRDFKWNNELCRYSGKYDSKKYSEAELRDTQTIISMLGSSLLSTETTAERVSEIENLNVAKLEKEYIAKRAEITGLKPVNTRYWLNVKNELLDHLDDYYELSKVTILGYKNPKLIMDFKGSNACSFVYGSALADGGEHLIAAWQLVNWNNSAGNPNRDRIIRDFDERNSSPQRFDYARIEVMRFGWWNCGIWEIRDVAEQENVHQKFLKLFTKVTEECDEP
ncbi:MAG: hypothetical protein ACK5NT_13375 [Pyrinomonadaceae bacterium]